MVPGACCDDPRLGHGRPLLARRVSYGLAALSLVPPVPRGRHGLLSLVPLLVFLPSPLFTLFCFGLLILLVKVQDSPVENEIVLVAFSEEQILEHTFQVAVVGAVLEAQAPAVVHIGGELGWHRLTEQFYRRTHFLFHYFFILLLFSSGPKTLPRQRPT